MQVEVRTKGIHLAIPVHIRPEPYISHSPDALRRSFDALSKDVLRRGLDALDVGIVILSEDLCDVLHQNAFAREVVGDEIPPQLRDAIEAFVLSRRQLKRSPPAMRVDIRGRSFFVRAVPTSGSPPLETVLIREEVLRDADAFRLLNATFGVSRREYQVLNGLRQGKTNRQVAMELGLAESTVAIHVHHLLERFEAKNRTRLVDIIEQHIARR